VSTVNAQLRSIFDDPSLYGVALAVQGSVTHLRWREARTHFVATGEIHELTQVAHTTTRRGRSGSEHRYLKRYENFIMN